MILGASGNLACHLASYYNIKGITTIGVARKKNINNENWNDFIISDFNEIDLSTVIKKIRPSIIINTVAETNLLKCEKNVDLAFSSNTLLPQKLINATKSISKNFLPYIVHISTDNVYSYSGFSDENNTLCINNYAATKYVGEMPFLSLRNSLILRTNFLGYGYNKTSFLDWLIVSMKSKAKIKLYSDVFFNPTTPCNIAENILISFKKI